MEHELDGNAVVVTAAVTYDGNDACGPAAQSVPAPTLIAPDGSVTLSELAPRRAGYRFLGWNAARTGIGFPYAPGERLTGLTADMTLYAQWGAEERACYTVTYHANEMRCGCCGDQIRSLPCPVGVWEGCSIAVALEMPIRRDYLFRGWNTQPDGSGVLYRPGDIIGPIEGDVELYAQWRALPGAGNIPVGPCCPLYPR